MHKTRSAPLFSYPRQPLRQVDIRIPFKAGFFRGDGKESGIVPESGAQDEPAILVQNAGVRGDLDHVGLLNGAVLVEEPVISGDDNMRAV